MSKRKPNPDEQPSREEVVEGLKGSLSRMLLALYATERLASTDEERAQTAEAIRMAEKLEEDTMAALGEPSQHETLRTLVQQMADLSALEKFLSEESSPDEAC